MERRSFLKKTSIAAAGGLAMSSTAFAKRTRFKWRLVMVIPKTLPIWGAGVQEFAKKVALISDGDLKIKVYGAGELVPALGTFDAIKSGRVQMGHSAAYYWQGKIPAAVFFTGVPFGMNAEGMRSWISYGGGQQLWDELYGKYGLIAMPAGNTGMQMGGWFNREIKTINDFKGLKMRIPGLGGRVLSKVGAKPMLVPGGEIYTNLATGVIDATEWVGPYHDYVMGFYKAAKYYYNPGWHEPGSVLELMINKEAWQKLPKDLQTLVRTCAAEMDRNMHAEWLAKDAEYLQRIIKEGKVSLKSFPKKVTRVLKEKADEAKKEIAATDPQAKRIYDSFTAFQSRMASLHNMTEKAYWQAFNS